jgi:site-specific recombinase XerC
MLYNTGARVQEIADLRLDHVSLTSPPHVRLHGKGDKWRTCPLWEETARVLRQWLDERRVADPHAPVFTSATGRALTRFGIYKRVRQHAARLESAATSPTRRITPHVFRHYVPSLTMSSDIGQLSRRIGRFRSQRGRGERIARHSLLDPTGC